MRWNASQRAASPPPGRARLPLFDDTSAAGRPVDRLEMGRKPVQPFLDRPPSLLLRAAAVVVVVG